MTQNTAIMNYMKNTPISQLEAYHKFGCTRLSARISEIRPLAMVEGAVVRDKWVKAGKKSYKQYWIEDNKNEV